MVARALITGITGMVGSHLADYLLANTDWEIYGMCRWRSPLDNISHLLPRINAKDRAHLLYGDLRDVLSIHDVVGKSKPNYVFHLAAQSFPRTSFEAPLDTFETNIQGPAHVLETLRMNKFDPVIHVCSSSEVFGRAKKLRSMKCAFHPAYLMQFRKLEPIIVAIMPKPTG
jgi:GDPmannose 4,6-dehydratase